MALFQKMLVRNYTPKNSKPYWPNVLSLLAISDRWEEITGKPDSSHWLYELGRCANNWTTPFSLVKNLSLKDVALLKKHGKIKIEDVFMFINDPEEKKALAKFLVREEIDKETLETLFSPEDLPLDLNEEPEPVPARDFSLNKSPPRDLDDEAGDDGGE